MKLALSLLACFALACGGTEPAPKSSSASAWHASSPREANEARVRVDPAKPWSDAARAIAAGGCSDAVLVWGDSAVDASVHPRPVAIALGAGEPMLEGFLVCSADMKTFLELQTTNPRFKAGHGGSADLKWRAGQLWLRRRWSAADIALGRLAPPPEGVFQRGEALAAIVSCEDPAVAPAELVSAIARAPSVFVFAMFPLAP